MYRQNDERQKNGETSNTLIRLNSNIGNAGGVGWFGDGTTHLVSSHNADVSCLVIGKEDKRRGREVGKSFS